MWARASSPCLAWRRVAGNSACLRLSSLHLACVPRGESRTCRRLGPGLHSFFMIALARGHLHFGTRSGRGARARRQPILAVISKSSCIYPCFHWTIFIGRRGTSSQACLVLVRASMGPRSGGRGLGDGQSSGGNHACMSLYVHVPRLIFVMQSVRSMPRSFGTRSHSSPLGHVRGSCLARRKAGSETCTVLGRRCAVVSLRMFCACVCACVLARVSAEDALEVFLVFSFDRVK